MGAVEMACFDALIVNGFGPIPSPARTGQYGNGSISTQRRASRGVARGGEGDRGECPPPHQEKRFNLVMIEKLNVRNAPPFRN